MTITKRLILLFFGAAFVVSNFIPFSPGGPAMSCVTAHISPDAAEQAVLAFMKSHSADIGEVARYLQRSDFEMIGGNINLPADQSANTDPQFDRFLLVFRANVTNTSCLAFSLALGLIPFSERTWIGLTLTPKPGEPSGNAMVIKVDGR